MNYTEYLCRIDDAKVNAAWEDFLGDYGYPADCPYDAKTLIIWSRIIFAASRNDWEALTEVTAEQFPGYKKLTNFAKHFEIPYMSLTNWINKSRQPPVYIIQLVGYAIISELPQKRKRR